MKTHQDAISGVFLILLSVVACVSAYRLGLGSMSNPGAGTIAFGIGLLMGVLALALIIKSLASGEKAAGAASTAGRFPLRPLLTLAVLVAYGVVLPLVGFVASTFCVMMALLWGIGRQKLVLSLAVSVATAAAAYLLFVTVFGLPFPQGSLWQLLER